MMLSNLFSTFERDMGIVCELERCTRQACFIVSIHQIDRCGAYGDSGCLHVLACGKCADLMRVAVHKRLKKMCALLRFWRCVRALPCLSGAVWHAGHGVSCGTIGGGMSAWAILDTRRKAAQINSDAISPHGRCDNLTTTPESLRKARHDDT